MLFLYYILQNLHLKIFLCTVYTVYKNHRPFQFCLLHVCEVCCQALPALLRRVMICYTLFKKSLRCFDHWSVVDLHIYVYPYIWDRCWRKPESGAGQLRTKNSASYYYLMTFYDHKNIRVKSTVISKCITKLRWLSSSVRFITWPAFRKTLKWNIAIGHIGHMMLWKHWWILKFIKFINLFIYNSA